ncbi:MAG: lysylphosphatidylglycerol synthase transmembrane domain-containing protein [Bacteroidetes bacterium]|nr:lysylphosphatidylglycerol synthase transmembrane domain-containing protein [Bacteroidota bacterium]
MQTDARQILKNFRPTRILLPVVLGLGAATYLLLHNFDQKAFQNIHWNANSTFWLCMALLMMVVRDGAYMVRIRALTDQELTWRNSFVVIMLWEFSSALAPGMIGGGFIFAIFILNRERINMGKSITAVLLSSFQDGVFLALMAPVVYFISGKERLFSTIDTSNLSPVTFGSGFFYSFWIVYFIILAYKIFVAYALFFNPRFVKWLLLKLFSLPLLSRWKTGALETGNQLVIASNHLKNKNRKFWVQSFGGTFVSWTARYTIVNCLILAFHNVSVDNFLIYARQVVMGIIILFSPTPGGSGLAEFMFNDFLGEFIPKGLAASLGLVWRLVSYYPYLFIGAIILPRWIRKHFKKPEALLS